MIKFEKFQKKIPNIETIKLINICSKYQINAEFIELLPTEILDRFIEEMKQKQLIV